MKKKPPPGATLIARLKEQRLAREQAAAQQKSESEGAVTAVPSPAPEATAAAPAKTVKEEVVAREPEQIIDAVVEDAPADDQTEAPQTLQTTVVRPERSSDLPSPSSNGTDLLHREIDIADLRPTSNDYFQLTDEIRLAGRFAAVGLIAQGLRLQILRDQNIYKDFYPSFEDYCRKEHHMSATYAYRLMRMSEMAERIAEKGNSVRPVDQSAAMPDPFEVMLGLGHRHLMALLPLEVETAEELLRKGIPVSDSTDDAERVPITRATEKQIREALKAMNPAAAGTTATRRAPEQSLASEKQLIPALSKLVEMLEDWSAWLGGDPPAELKAARIGRRPLLGRLGKRFRAASARIADALEREED